MQLPLFVACLVASSSWSFSFADESASRGNPKTAQKQYARSATPSGMGQQSGTSPSQTAPTGGTLGVSAVFPDPWDDCATPLVITTVSGSNLIPFDNTVDTTGTQGQSLGTFGCNSQLYACLFDIWFEWTAPWSTLATIQTCGQTAVDTKLVMWSGAGCPAATWLACNNNSGVCAPQSQLLNVWVTAGTTYMIQLGSSAAGGGQPPGVGNLEIIIFQPPPAPPNDACAGALSITGAGPFFFDNTGATDDPGMPALWCGAQWGHDAWFEWTAGFTGVCQAQTCNGAANFDTLLEVFPAGLCPGMAADIGCNDDGCATAGPSQMQFNCVIGTQYEVRVGGKNHENNAFGVLEMLNVAAPPPAPYFCFGDGTGQACPCDPGQSGSPGHGCANSTGEGAILSVTGSSSVSSDSLQLHVANMRNPTTVVFIQGTLPQNGGQGSFGGDGLLCVNGSGGNLIRLGMHRGNLGSSDFGAGVGSDPLISVRGQVPAIGATRYYQAYYRDNVAYCTMAAYNFSNGAAVVWTP